MLVEEQIQERQKRAKDAIQSIRTSPATQPFGDYEVLSTSGKEYRVAMRGPGLFENYCTCPDFARNTLGTCKHIESILGRLRARHKSKLSRRKYERERASVSLLYGETLDVQLKLPDRSDPALQQIAAKHFDTAGLLRRDQYAFFANIMEGIRKADASAVVYSDAVEYVDRVNELQDGLAWEREQLARLDAGKRIFRNLVKVPLFPYQERGVLFAAARGRVILADDMGLGKTIQAIAAAAFLRSRRGIAHVLVISPASVKYQWKTEIERFSDLSVQVIDGRKDRRTRLYSNPAFFNLINYELVPRDLDQIQALTPDLIILDEAQRIRNWTTNTARTVKQLKSRYAFVLTGTPLENKLEELYSVVEFVDGRVLGPAFRFLHEHVETSETGRLLGYRGLYQIHQQLEPVLLRRKRDQVLKELPERTDQTFRVPLTKQQAEPYWEQHEIVARLVRKWERQGWLSEVDLRRLTCGIQNMRMLCNSTFLFDKETNFSPKIGEFREVVRELTIEENRKVVVFSEYERMTRLAGEELTRLGIDFVSLHGGVPTRRRGALMQRFREDPDCMVFLSTDAGGVGLNLQAASAVINFEPPWNPARLEQRIARVHRMGQSEPVQVIHMLTEGSIEERVWATLHLKKALFSGLFDSTADEVSFEQLGRSNMLKVVGEVIGGGRTGSDAPGAEAPPPVETGEPDGGGRLDPPPPEESAGTVGGGQGNGRPGPPGSAGTPPGTDPPAPPPKAPPVPPQPDGGLDVAVAGLVAAGVRFLEALSGPPAAATKQAAHGVPSGNKQPAKGGFSNLVKTDPQTNRPIMAIPLPEDLDAARIEQALGGLLRKFTGSS